MASILVVDDEPDILKVSAILLEFEGHQVHTAGNGRQALEILARHAIDLVLTDWMMAEMNGLELCEALRGRDDTRAIPIIMATSAATAPEGLGRLFDAVVSKLASIDKLVATIERLLAKNSPR